MNKKIFITGASGGIGSAICKKFLDKNLNQLSCIFFEPIQGCLPTKKAKKYIKFNKIKTKTNLFKFKILFCKISFVFSIKIVRTNIEIKMNPIKPVSCKTSK